MEWPTELSQQSRRRNPARAVKDVCPISVLSAHNDKGRETQRKKAEQQLRQEQQMHQQSARARIRGATAREGRLWM